MPRRRLCEGGRVVKKESLTTERTENTEGYQADILGLE